VAGWVFEGGDAPSPRLVFGGGVEREAFAAQPLVVGVDVVDLEVELRPFGVFDRMSDVERDAWPSGPVASARRTKRAVSSRTLRPRCWVYQSRSCAGSSTKSVTSENRTRVG
jgi:hypothetical protein